MKSGNQLQNDITDIQDTIKKLSDIIKACGVSWNDEQYTGLNNSIRSLAASSKDLINVSNNCNNAIKKFRQIEGE